MTRHNPEKRAWRGRSYRKGGQNIRSLRESQEEPEMDLTDAFYKELVKGSRYIQSDQLHMDDLNSVAMLRTRIEELRVDDDLISWHLNELFKEF